jgi:hypothetical protein
LHFCLLPDQRQSSKTLRSAEQWAGQWGSIAMERRDEREFREELVSLRAQHRQLDCEIMALEADPSADQLLVKRLKKKKLVLKDRITQIEDKLLPDIIA